MSTPIRSSFIPFDLSSKLYSKQTPWKPSPAISEQFQPIPPNDPDKFRLYKVQRGPEFEFATRYFLANKPLGFGASNMEFVRNPNLQKSFESHLETMNMQAKNPIFAPTWEKDLKQTKQRKQVIADWESSVEQFSSVVTTDGELINDAKVLPLLHGSSIAKSKSILSTGFTFFGKQNFFNPDMGLTSFSTDQGYFGSGIYLTDSFEYAKMYSRDGIVVICWVGHRPPLPVVSDVKHPKKCSDMTLLEGRERFLNHNMHLIPVDQVKGLVYFPCFEDQKAKCKEYVVFDSPQVLPWMVITLSPDGPERPIGSAYTVDDFSLACQHGQYDQVKIWFNENRKRIQDKNGMGETFLFSAVIGNQLALFEWLCKQHPELLGVKREDNSSVLHLAMASGYKDIVVWIKAHSPQLMYEKNDQGDTPLYLAAFYGQKELLEIFIEDVKTDPEIVLKLSQTPNTDILAFLVEKGVSAQVINRQKQTPLHLAAQSGQPQNVEFLLDQGLDINAADQNRRTPLFLAATQGQERIVKLLLERKAATDVFTVDGETLLHVAAFYGYMAILESLFPFCKSLINAPDDDGKTPLHKAVWGNPKPEVVKWLLLHGADSQSKTYNRILKIAFNYTPLHWAAKHGHLESAQALIEKGAELDATNSNGEMPYELAVRFGHDPVARLLIDPQFTGSQDTLFLKHPSESDCLEKFKQALQSQEKHNQLLCLEKLADLHLQQKDYNRASLVLNSAFVLAEKHQILGYQKLVYKKLERIEGEFISEKFGSKLSADHSSYLLKNRAELATIRQSIQEAISTQSLQKTAANAFQQFFSKLVEQCCEMVGKQAPARFAVVSFGDFACGDLFPYSAFRFGIFVDNASTESKTYFQQLHQLIRLRVTNLGETECGLPSLEGESSLTRSGWCLEPFERIDTPDQFVLPQTRVEFKKNSPEIGPESKCVFGDSTLHESYQKALQTAFDKKLHLIGQKWREERAVEGLKQLLQQVSALRAVKQIDLSQFSLHQDLYKPLQQTLRFLGMYYDSPWTSGFEIVQHLEKQKILTEPNAQKLQQALSQLVRLKIQVQFNRKNGEDVSLLDIEKGKLVDVFQTVVALYKACEDLTANRSKPFAKPFSIDQEIKI